MMETSWEERIAAAWASIDQYKDEAAFRALIDRLAAELRGFLALALVDLGREREAVALALGNYARLLVGE